MAWCIKFFSIFLHIRNVYKNEMLEEGCRLMRHMMCNCPLDKNLVIYNNFNFDHIDVAVGSFATSVKSLSLRHKTISLLVLSTISVFCICDMLTNNAPSPFNIFSHFCRIKTTYISTFHNLKFSMFHFDCMILTKLIHPFVSPWASIVVNSNSNLTPINLDMYRKRKIVTNQSNLKQ